MNQVLTLKKPISAHGNEVTSLTFREPTGSDIIELGMPFSFGKDKRTYIDTVVTAGYIERLANIPMSSVRKLSPQDFQGAFGVVAGFFGGSEDLTTDQKKSSDDTTNSQGSTAAV